MQFAAHTLACWEIIGSAIDAGSRIFYHHVGCEIFPLRQLDALESSRVLDEFVWENDSFVEHRGSGLLLKGIKCIEKAAFPHETACAFKNEFHFSGRINKSLSDVVRLKYLPHFDPYRRLKHRSCFDVERETRARLFAMLGELLIVHQTEV